jgi:hypothetical protein
LDLLSKEEYDYYVWIDADAHFYINAPPLDIVIKRFPNQKLILSGDYPHKKQIWEINSGFFIVKNCKECFNILMAWAYSDSIKYISNKNQMYGNFHDQQVIRYMYDKNILNTKLISVVVPYCALQHFFPNNPRELAWRPFIIHLAGNDSATRRAHSLTYYIHNVKLIQKLAQVKT